jgi:hypothetical protein
VSRLRFFVPIFYGLPAAETSERARRGEIVLGGCCLQEPRWYCRECLNRWPEDPPTPISRTSERQKKYLEEKQAEYQALAAAIVQPAAEGEPVVTDMWPRAEGRLAFMVLFPWGRARIQKEVHLLSLGGPPVYEWIAGMPPETGDWARAEHLAAETRTGPTRTCSPPPCT